MASINSERASLSPTQHQQHAHSTQIEDDSAFESLVESSKALLEALQTWLTANTKHAIDNTNNSTNSTPPSASSKTPTKSTAVSVTQEDNSTASLLNFDAAWTSYYNFFEAWKDKDAQRLLRTLLDHAQQIESLWRTVQSDPTARSEWGPRIEEQRRDLRDKARQLAGPDGVARLDEVFADFVTATTPPSTVSPPAITAPATATPTDAATPMETDIKTATQAPQPETAESLSSAPLEATTITATPATKKRQRLLSVSNSDSAMDVDQQPPAGSHVVPATSAEATLANTGEDPALTGGEEPQAKKPFKARGPRQPMTPAGFEKQENWSNLQLIHELALDPNFKIESKRVGGNESTAAEDAEEGTTSSGNVNSMESLESRIRAMATKAYFDKIREDAEQGQLGKWIPLLLTTIREQLLDMVPQESSVARQIRDGFDLEFVQQQVDRKVYDVKGALEGVLGLMAKLCAPVRDPAIRQIQQDLSFITGNPLQQTPAQTSSRPAASSATSATPKDLVSVLKDILELLEEMLMDLANYRLMVARPSLEKQAIPYEQHAFKTSLENGEITLDATTAWLEVSAANLARAAAISTTTTTTATASSSSSGSKSQPSLTSSPAPAESAPSSSSSSSTKTNRHYEVYVNAVLDLLFSKTPLELATKEEFPETFVLDQARLTRYQNELQALALIAVMWNISLNVQPPLRDEGQQELKQTLFRLMENADTSKETLAEAIIEAKEKTLLLTSRPSPTASTRSASSSSSATTPTTALLLSAEQKSYLRNTIERAISFDSSLYSVLSQRIRKVLESYLLSSPPGGKPGGVMPEQVELNKSGLGTMAKEIETFAAQIGFLIRYNAKVYQPWYDPLLTRILPGTTRNQRTPATAAHRVETSGPVATPAAEETMTDKAVTLETKRAEDDDDKANGTTSSSSA
jgi:hypothetical protein